MLVLLLAFWWWFNQPLSAAAEKTLPALSTEEKLRLRDTELAAVKANDQLNDFMRQVQRQMEQLPEYKTLQERAVATSAAYAAAVKEAEAKCADCKLDATGLVLRKPPTTPPATSLVPAPPPAAKPALN